MATGNGPSDFVVRPVLRIGSAGFALRHVIVHVGDGPAGGLGEDSWNDRVNNAGAAGANQPSADRDSANAVSCPAHPKGAWMFQEHAVGQSRASLCLLLGRHVSPLTSLDLVTPTGFEPVAYRLGICRSILLSYGAGAARIGAAAAPINDAQSIHLVGWSDRQRQRRDGHAVLDERLRLLNRCIAVDDRGFDFAAVNGTGRVGELITDPLRVL